MIELIITYEHERSVPVTGIEYFELDGGYLYCEFGDDHSETFENVDVIVGDHYQITDYEVSDDE